MVKEIYKVADFNRENIAGFYKDLGENEFLSLWSPSELPLLSKISPLTVERINERLQFPYSVSREGLIEQAKSLAAFLTLSIDNSVFKGIMNPEMVKSKVRHLEKMCTALGQECPISQEDVNENNFLDYAYITKKLALGEARKHKRTFDNTNRLEPKRDLEAAFLIADMFGDNLERIIQYGSSVNGDGKDIDMMVLLKRIDRKTYDSINGRRDQIHSTKPLSIVMLPSDALTAYAECDYHSLTIAREGKLVYGQALDFPVMGEKESVRKMYFKAGKELTSIRATLGDKKRAEQLANRPEFLRETLKLEIWVRKALLQKEMGKYLTKEEYFDIEPKPESRLKENPSAAEVREELYDLNCRLKDRIKQHLNLVGNN